MKGRGLGRSLRHTDFGRFVAGFMRFEAAVLERPLLSSVTAALALLLLLALYRKCVALQSARFTAKATGIQDELKGLRFPLRPFSPIKYLLDRPKGATFVGLTPKRRLLPPWGVRWKPVYLSSEERSMHRHVLGKTGSGKTTSILWPQVTQDVLDGKGVLVIDAKGSDENARMMRNIARLAGRDWDLRIFALPAWNRPQLFSHAYNMVHVRPRGWGHDGGDVMAMAERVFSVFELGDNPYYATQGFLAFTRICRLLHGMVDSKGRGLPFNLSDVAVCLRGLVAPSTRAGKAYRHCDNTSREREAADELRAQVSSLGSDLGPCLSGLMGAVDRFQSPLVNAYDPDFNFDEVLQYNRIIYVQLPSNLFKIQAPALGKVMLMDLQQEASLRQVFRNERNQRPFAVVVDEFGSFADMSIIDSLNKLRDAHIQFTLSHQSMADLELVSKEFAQGVWDNTRTKDILALDSPELCETIARSLGTYPRLEHTVQQGPGVLATTTATGVLSTRAVEAYRLHPNRLKMLAARGQGFLFATRNNLRTATPVIYGPMPELPDHSGGKPLRRNNQEKAPGLRLHLYDGSPETSPQPPESDRPTGF